MKYIKESLESDYYNLYGNTVYVKNYTQFGNDEYRVEYITKDNEESAYIGSDREVAEDFTETEDSFKVKFPKKPKKKRSKSDHKTYDLVYYMGKRKQETIKLNVDIVLAKGLKRLYSSFPQYKTGELKVVPNMTKESIDTEEDYMEIEFVCHNSEYEDSTSKKNQKDLYEDLKKIEGLVPYMQDFSDDKHDQLSLAVIIENTDEIPSLLNKVKGLAKKHGVNIDLYNKRSEDQLWEIKDGIYYDNII